MSNNDLELANRQLPVVPRSVSLRQQQAPYNNDNNNANQPIMDSEMKETLSRIFCVIAFLCITVLFPVLMSQSFVVVGNDEYGIVYHKLSLKIDDKVLQQGRYYVPVGSALIKYKRTVQVLDMATDSTNSVICLTQDGVNIEVDAKVQYQFKKDKIRDILNTYGPEKEIKSYIFNVCRESVRNVCSNFTISDVYFKRTYFQDRMLAQIVSDFNKFSTHTDATLVQLINVDIPTAYTNVLNQLQSATQEISQAQNERVGQLILETTEYDLELRNYQIKLIQAQAQAESVRRQFEEQANVTRTIWAERTTSYLNIMNNLKLTPEEFVDSYLRSQAILASNSSVINL